MRAGGRLTTIEKDWLWVLSAKRFLWQVPPLSFFQRTHNGLQKLSWVSQHALSWHASG